MWALEHMCLCRCEHMCVCLHMYEYILVFISEGVCALLYGVGCIDAQALTLGKWKGCRWKKEKLQSDIVVTGSMFHGLCKR